MLKLIGGAALAAMLAFAPATDLTSTVSEAPAHAAAAPVHTAALAEFGLAVAGNSGLAAAGQSAQEFRTWIGGAGPNRDSVDPGAAPPRTRR